jgi:hypothetical protein
MVIEASSEEHYIFESNYLCMISYLVGDDHQLDNMFMHVDEERRCLGEMAELEIFLVEHVFMDLDDEKEISIEGEDKYNQMKTCNSYQNNRKTSFGKQYSITEQDRDNTQYIEECMVMLAAIKSDGPCDFEIEVEHN